jgi:hypothetical protein
MAFRSYLAWPKGADEPQRVVDGVPCERERVEPLPDTR